MKAREISTSALFVALIALSASIIIPTPIVPFSLQPLTIFLTALVLPKRQALWTIIVYIIVGLIGFPVFSGGNGGPIMLIKPTFGFIIGFIPMVYFANRFQHLKLKGIRIASCITGILVLYAVALPYLYWNLTFLQKMDVSFVTLISNYCLMFIPTDVASFSLASLIADKLLH